MRTILYIDISKSKQEPSAKTEKMTINWTREKPTSTKLRGEKWGFLYVKVFFPSSEKLYL